ncbi:MAG: ACT domain-containing protein [Synergistaceae bacterium]|jgi:aspartate kinase|nr:ACT domain-containing protein [Synergistaceae bacterium]
MQNEISARVSDVRIDRSSARITLLGVPDVPGAAARIFSALAERGVGVEMIVQNNMRGGITDIGFLAAKERLNDAVEACRSVSKAMEVQGVSFSTEIARVSLVGEHLPGAIKIPAKMFSTLAEVGVNIDMIAFDTYAITCVVVAGDAEKAAASLREKFLCDEE